MAHIKLSLQTLPHSSFVWRRTSETDEWRQLQLPTSTKWSRPRLIFPLTESEAVEDKENGKLIGLLASNSDSLVSTINLGLGR